MKRALVCSAGGSKGAYAGGIVEQLIESGVDWDLYFGSSTGSLIIPLTASKNIKALKEGYTTITDKDIFTSSPFNLKEVNGELKYDISYFRILRNVVLKKQHSLGDSRKLRETISKLYPIEEFNKAKEENKSVNVFVTNLDEERLEIKRNLDCEYEDFCDWMWASTCAPPFMSIAKKDGYNYVDSGVMRYTPIRDAIIHGADEIDAIVLGRENPKAREMDITNPLTFIFKLLSVSGLRIYNLDRNLHNFVGITQKPVRINMYYIEEELTNTPLIFQKEKMTEWWDIGYNYAKDARCKSYLLSKEGVQEV